MSAPYTMLLAIDFETRWDSKEYTLSKLTTEEYIRDEKFKAFGACIHEYGTDAVTQWYGGAELHRVLSTYDWTKTAVLAHNAQFDISILEWVYGVHPCFIFDSLSMARALRGVEVGNSLAKLASDFGLPPKGRAVYSTDGLADITPEIEKELAEYCKHDVFLCEEIFKRLVSGYPAKELRLIDMTMKMYTRPMLELDEDMLFNALHEEREAREALLERLQIADADLASNDRFAELLRKVGMEPPTKKKKPTVKTPEPIGENYAFAKTDAMFQAMLNGDNEDVRQLCEARLKVKSTSERTRAQRFLDIAGRGTLPVPLSYYGAATGRWTASKGSAINMQNLKRGSFLRKAIMAPEGHVCVVGDLSQIEPRVLAWLADYDDMLHIFNAGGDPYAQFGAQMFNIPDLSKESHPDLRQSAKSALLGAGYGLGWASFAAQLLVGFLGAPPQRYDKAFAKKLGVTGDYIERFLEWDDNVKKMEEIPHTCTAQELLIHCVAAKKIIDIYRATAHAVAGFWELCSSLIQRSLADGEEYKHKCLIFRKEEIVLPSGMSLLYPNLRQQKDKDGRSQWVYGPEATKIYAGKITNNCLSEGTLVLTDSGWVAIEQITTNHRVHDGVEFVSHDGKIFNGIQKCVTLRGIALTPEHKVLTQYGWQEASQVQEPYRPDLRHVDRASARLIYREGVAMAVPVPLWEKVRKAGGGCNQGVEARGEPELRMRNKAPYRAGEHLAWNEQTPRIHRVAQYGESLHKAFGAGIQKLWRTGDHCMRALDYGVRVLLERHAAHIPAGVGAGSQGQQRAVYRRELPLGDAPREQHESKGYRATRGCNGVEPQHGDTCDDAVLPAGARLAVGAIDPHAERKKPVYDIVNAGPRSRFVVLGSDGPFIVHNCVQGTARVVMTDGMLRVAKRYPVVGTVHDELIAIAPEREAQDALKWVLEQMTLEPSYMPGIPLAADGGFHRRYGLAKK